MPLDQQAILNYVLTFKLITTNFNMLFPPAPLVPVLWRKQSEGSCLISESPVGTQLNKLVFNFLTIIMLYPENPFFCRMINLNMVWVFM